MAAQSQESDKIKKLLLFAAVSLAFLFIWTNYISPPPQKAAQNQEVAQSAPSTHQGTQTAPQGNGSQQLANAPSGAQPLNQPAQVFPEERTKLTVDGAEVILSNKGGRVVSVTIDHPERFLAAGDLLGDFPKDSTHYPFAIDVENGIVNIPYDYTFEFVKNESIQSEAGYSKVVYRYTDPAGRFLFDKIYQTKENSPYQYNLVVRLKNLMTNAALNEQVVLSIVGFENPNVEHSFLETRADQMEGLCKMEDDLERVRFDKIEDIDGYTGNLIWGAIDRRYFLFAAIPENSGVACSIAKVDQNYLRTKITQKSVSLKPTESAEFKWLIYSGPKNYGLLSSIGHELRESVDFGMLSFIARPLRWTLAKINEVVGNWGFSIIILTILIRLLLWPLNQVAYSQTEKMRRIQPQINEIKEKYKGDPQKIQEEQMRIMRESGTTPFGCLPMFLQFPILIGLYVMILNSVELYHAHFILWYTNLAARDPYFVLPILMGITMFLQQHFMAPEMDPSNPAASMQKVMKLMPVIFTAFMLFLPSGVVLYYFVSLLIGLGQQWYIRKSLKQKYADLDAEIEREIVIHENQSKSKKK